MSTQKYNNKGKIRLHQPPINIDILYTVLNTVPNDVITLRVKSLRPLLINYALGGDLRALIILNKSLPNLRINKRVAISHSHQLSDREAKKTMTCGAGDGGKLQRAPAARG